MTIELGTNVCDVCGQPVSSDCVPHEVTTDDEFGARLCIHNAETALQKYRDDRPMVVLDDTSKPWGSARAFAEAMRIRMDQARETEHELALKWISGGCKLNTYESARRALETATNEYLRASDEETRLYDVLTNYQQEDGADVDAASEDERARSQS